jgi:hypothetical protein
MRKIHRPLIALVISLGLIFLSGCQSGDTTQAANGDQQQGFWQKLTRAPQKVTIPPGTPLEVRLDQTLSSGQNQGGDTFQATLVTPLTVNERVVVPKGARVTGQVVDARASGHLKTPAALSITLTELEVKDSTYDISTSTYSRAVRSHKKRNLAWIGGSAAGGALLGALVGGGKGAAIGAGIGAGGGTAAAYATGKHDIVLPSESLLRFRLEAPMTITE